MPRLAPTRFKRVLHSDTRMDYGQQTGMATGSKRGTLIVVEGLDRSGKSTQCERLAHHLRHQGMQVEHMRFPNRATPIGKMISNYLTGQTEQEDHVIHLLFSANRWESAVEIERLIREGTTVVIDRYYYSGCVYTAAKQRPGMDLAWCRQPEVGLPRADVCLFLDVSAEVVEKRGGFGTERYERREMQDRVRGLFTELRKHDDEANDIVTINASPSVDEVAESIRDAVAAVFQRLTNSPAPLQRVRPW